MESLHLFTDGSVNPATKTGYGAYIVLRDTGALPSSLRDQVKLRVFENTTPVRLELETLLWAFNEIGQSGAKIIVYTDSQNIMNLPERRSRLERNNYKSDKMRPLKNADLYIEFFRIKEMLAPVFIKVKGHMASKHKDNIDKLFALVDMEARKALRKMRG